MERLIAFFVRRGLLVNLVSALLVAGGLYAAFTIRHEAFPSVNFDLVVITAAYPGASPEEIERLLVNPLEAELKELDGIKEIRSTAFPGAMQISITIEPEYRDRARFVSDVQRAVDRADLPDDLLDKPTITEIKSEQAPILSFSLFGKLSELELQRLARRVRDDLLDIPGVARVLVQGKLHEEIRIVLSPDKMRRYRITIGDVARAIRGWNITAPGGKIVVDGKQRVIRIVGEFRSAADAAQLVLRANVNHAVRLGDVAQVVETLERPRRIIRAMGDPAVNMIVLKKGDADILATVDRVRAYLKTIPKRLDPRLHTRVYSDFSIVTRLRLGVLTNNGALGLVLVLLVLSLFLRPAVATTTAWGLPVIFFGGLLALFLAGQTLNLLTMFGFIIVLGLMVDDAIIIGENIAWHMERGAAPERAAVAGTAELAGPVIATVLTTIVAFLPLMFMKGIIGKFVFSIPLVVITLLAFSLLEALFILPNHIRDLARPGPSKPRRWFQLLRKGYAPLLRVALRHPVLALFVIFAAFAGSLALASKMRFQLFPPGAESRFYLRVELPPGTTLEETDQVLKRMDAAARKLIPPEILETTITIAGENSADRREALKRLGDRFGFLEVVLIPFTERTISAYTIMNRLREKIPPMFPEAKISFAMMKPGPPVGRALQVELEGDEAAMRRVAARLAKWLETIPGVFAVETDLAAGDPEMHLVVDRRLAAFAGVDLATIAAHIRAAFDGWTVSTLRHGTEEVRVTIRYPERLRRSPEELLKLEIPNARGGTVPLGEIARFVEHPGATSIHHKNGHRILYVSAEVDPKRITSRALNRLVRKHAKEWLGPDADKVRFHLGGEQERSEESVRGLVFSFLFALAGIYAILAVQFNSLAWPLLVLFAVPFGLIGVIVGFFLHGEPLSFMALMGFVALTGVVVNDALVIAVVMQRRLREGVPAAQAAYEAGLRRLRPVLLTTLTTVVGLMPTAYGWGGLDPFVAPMALALSWGLLFATAITLFGVPAAFVIAAGFGARLRSRMKFAS